MHTHTLHTLIHAPASMTSSLLGGRVSHGQGGHVGEPRHRPRHVEHTPREARHAGGAWEACELWVMTQTCPCVNEATQNKTHTQA